MDYRGFIYPFPQEKCCAFFPGKRIYWQLTKPKSEGAEESEESNYSEYSDYSDYSEYSEYSE